MTRKTIVRKPVHRVHLGDRINPVRKKHAAITQEVIDAAKERFTGTAIVLPDQVSFSGYYVGFTSTPLMAESSADMLARHITLDK